jgi:glyoxylase-like metal-dependent hydrolase (beta-lactamase superfamily II)
MTAYVLTTRRVLLRDMGKAGLALIVFGTAACASETGSTTTVANTTDGTPDPTTTVGGATSSSEGAGTTQPAATGHEWVRANLGFVSAYVLYRAGEAAVVDTGVAGSEAAIEAALGEAGLGWGDVGHVILTHKHPDHQGSLEAILEAAPGAAWYAGTGDMPAINAGRPGTAVEDGARVFDLEIVATPGHTPGHVAVLDPVSGVLVTGDAARGDGGAVGPPNPQFSEDIEMAFDSVRKMAGLDYEVILFGHGEPVLTGGTAAMAALAATLG